MADWIEYEAEDGYEVGRKTRKKSLGSRNAEHKRPRHGRNKLDLSSTTHSRRDSSSEDERLARKETKQGYFSSLVIPGSKPNRPKKSPRGSRMRSVHPLGLSDGMAIFYILIFK